jgi:hypothetical protein
LSGLPVQETLRFGPPIASEAAIPVRNGLGGGARAAWVDAVAVPEGLVELDPP